MILIGFTIFSIIIFTTYTTFDAKKEYINHFELADSVLGKISSSQAVFIKDHSLLHLQSFTSLESTEYIKQVRKNYQSYGYNFTVKLTCENNEYWNPSLNYSERSMMNRFACSQQISVALNEVIIVPGTITVIFWSEST